ncbi:30S ribosomal protein S20 [Haloplasma contractile]|uniref:Small ribosomal subunit protein bS20 n=1 Tax=Haloplasma contractile SSD-17B TaxID=1033810 RepID=U2DZX3_9MOLU|nr:30S ribosomal protein S20 [Haloplasma contractile]ERJ13737.1 30S ribosomal protein S20 [Haloplasma contractile SSD-17B]
MPNIKSQEKRAKTNEKRRLQNAAFKSQMRTVIKAVETAVQNNDVETAKSSYRNACKFLDKSVSKGINHKNYAANQKSRLAKLVNSVA